MGWRSQVNPLLPIVHREGWLLWAGGPGLTLCCPQEAEGGLFVGVEADYYGLGGPGLTLVGHRAERGTVVMGQGVIIMGWRPRLNPLLPIGHRRGVVLGVESDYYGMGLRVNPLLPAGCRRGAFHRGAGDYYGLGVPG